MTLKELWSGLDEAMDAGDDAEWDRLMDAGATMSSEHWWMCKRWRNHRNSQGPKPTEPGDDRDSRQSGLFA